MLNYSILGCSFLGHAKMCVEELDLDSCKELPLT